MVDKARENYGGNLFWAINFAPPNSLKPDPFQSM